VLATPGASSPIATLKCDEDVTIVYDEVGFYKVQVGKGTQGYISHLFVTNPMQKLLVRDGSHDGIARVGTSGIAPPTCSHCPDPKYTAEARSAKYEGNIVLEAVITTEGKAAYVRAIRVTTLNKQIVGTRTLDRAWVSLEETAIDAVKQWRFKPAQNTDGKPVAVLVPIEISFRFVK
jgi:TonB family protein